jgi:hypothetical protein
MTAGETLGSVFPISVSFVQGEQPASGKFSGWANQTSAGLNKLARAIGDLWGEEFTDNKLYVSTQRPPHIINLARLIGPASAINPLRPVAPATRVEYDVVIDPDDIPIGVNEFNLRTHCDCEPPIDYTSDWPSNGIILHTSIETALEFISSVSLDTVFITRVSTKDLVNGSGDYYVDTHGNVLTYNVTGDYNAISPSASTTYQTCMTPDMYDQATLNVIPDMNQTTSDGLCDVLSNSEDSAIPVGEYVIRTPYLTKLARRDSLNNALEPGDSGCPPLDFATNERARLPYVLKASDGMNLSDGDMIPDQFIGLWDETNSVMVTGLTFKLSNVTAATDPDGFDSDYCVIATGGTLTANAVSPAKGTRYRLVTVGTTITELLSYLVRRVDTHTHGTRQSGYPVLHTYLADKTIPPTEVSSSWSIDVRSPPSTVLGNDHPQYLCRYGWFFGLDGGQQDNAMLGDLFMGAVQSNYITGSYNDNSADSRKIYFGHSTGPRLWWDNSQNRLVVDSTGGAKGSLQLDVHLYIGHTQTTRYAYFGPTSGQLNFIRQSDADGFSLREDNSVAESEFQCGAFAVHNDGSEIDVDNALPPTNIETIRMNIFDDSPNSTHDALIQFYVDDTVYGGQVNIGIDGYNSTIGGSAFVINSNVDIYLDAGGTIHIADGNNLRLFDGSNYVEIVHGAGLFLVNTSGDALKLDSDTDLYLDADDNILFTAPTVNMTGIGATGAGLVIPLSAPSSPVDGSMYYDTSANTLYIRDGGSWLAVLLT